MFWSNARGKVGDVVFSTVKGQTITRKYQPSPANPRTDAQQLQRAKFSNAVKFFKHAQQAYFKFAYEDRKKTESDYNAFMRYNAGVAMMPTREQYLGKFPSIGSLYQVAAGSLPSIEVSEVTNAEILFNVGTTEWADAPTIGNLSAALVAKYGLQDGDIITLLRIDCHDVSEITDVPATYPSWIISQFRLDAASSQLVSDAVSDTKWKLVTSTESDAILACEASRACVMGAIIVSRVLTSGTKVSNSYLYIDQNLQDIYNQSLAESWRKAALSSWDASGAAVLQGSLSE